jgi:hypothetical protein
MVTGVFRLFDSTGQGIPEDGNILLRRTNVLESILPTVTKDHQC